MMSMKLDSARQLRENDRLVGHALRGARAVERGAQRARGSQEDHRGPLLAVPAAARQVESIARHHPVHPRIQTRARA